jgi:hypothetical protein
VCLLIGMLAFSRFSLDSREHARIRAVIDSRGGQGAPVPQTSGA